MREFNASRTAYLIAESAVYLSFDKKYLSLFPKRYLELCSKFAEARPLRKKLLYYANHISFFRCFYLFVQEKAIPGIRQHYLLRKREIEELVRKKIKDGYAQIVILGAGFDTLTVRLADEFPSITFIEVDHPSTQKEKIRTISNDRLSYKMPHFIPADLAKTDLAETLLRSAGFDPDKKTLFVAEGLLMYLTEDEVTRLFASVGRASHKASAFIFTAIERSEAGQIKFHGASRFVDWWLKIYGEPFKWGLQKADIPSFLYQQGFRTETICDGSDLRKCFMSGPKFSKESLARGEFICLGIKDTGEK